jgi:hypothetical protein
MSSLTRYSKAPSSERHGGLQITQFVKLSAITVALMVHAQSKYAPVQARIIGTGPENSGR